MGIHLGEAGDPAAQLRLPFDEEDREAHLGQSESGPEAGDAASHDQALRRRLDDDRLERVGEPSAVDTGAHQAQGLLSRSHVVVGVRPGALLAHVHLGVLEGVHARAPGNVPEGVGVELGRTGRDHQPVETLLLGILDDLLLGRVGAREHGGLRDHDVGLLGDRGDDLVNIDVVADVAPALADVHPDLVGAHAMTFSFDSCLVLDFSR